jgi:hypothetical protein
MLASGKPLSRTKGQAADAHLKRNASPSEVRIMGREAVVAATNGRLDGSTEGLAEVFGTWERIF